MAAAVAAAGASAVTDQTAVPKDEVKAAQKVAQKAEAMSAASAARSSEATSLVVTNAVSSGLINAASSGLTARSSATPAHRVTCASHVNPVKAAGQSARAANVANEA